MFKKIFVALAVCAFMVPQIYARPSGSKTTDPVSRDDGNKRKFFSVVVPTTTNGVPQPYIIHPEGSDRYAGIRAHTLQNPNPNYFLCISSWATFSASISIVVCNDSMC